MKLPALYITHTALTHFRYSQKCLLDGAATAQPSIEACLKTRY